MSGNLIRVIISALDQTGPGVSGASSSLKKLAAHASVVAREFVVLKYAVQEAFQIVTEPIKEAVDAINTYQSAVIQTAALITSFQGNKGNIGENYRQAKEYATALQEKLIEINATVSLSGHELSMVTEEMMKQRVLVDVNNQKQLEGLRNIANAVAVIAGGYQNKEVQIRQEVRALMQGEVNMNAQLSSQINSMVGGGLKQKLEQWKQEGTIVEHIGELLVGYTAAAKDIANTWGAVKTTTETIWSKILRDGFGSAFKDLLGWMSEFNTFLKSHQSDLQQILNRGWLLVKGTLEIIVNLFTPLLKSSGALGEIVSGIFHGLGYIAYAVLPPLATRVGEIAAGMFEWVKMAFNLGKLLWQAFSFDWDGVKETWDDIQKNFAESGKHAGAAFQEGFLKEIGERAYDFDQKFTTSRISAPAPVLPKAPQTKQQLQEARAAEEARLKVQLEGYAASNMQQAAALKRQEAEVEEYYKSGIINEREFQEWKRQIQEQAVTNDIGMLQKREAAEKASWEKRKGLYFSDELKEQSKARGDYQAEIKKVEGEIAKKREELATIGIKGRIDELDYTKKLSQAERDGVLKVMEEEIALQKEKNDLLTAQGLISPLEQKQREIDLERQLLQLKIRKLEIDREQTLDDPGKAAKAAEIDALRKQLSGLDVKGEKERVDYGDFAAGLKKGFKDFETNARQYFRIGADLAKQTADAMQQAFSDGFFDIMNAKFNSLGKYILNFLQTVQRAIANFFAQMATNALISNIGSWATSFFGAAGGGGSTPSGPSGIGTVYAHTGGLILHGGGLVPRFHFGGLASDEVPAVLLRKERVLSIEQNQLFEKFVNKTEQPAGVNVAINIENQTGQPVDAKVGNMRFDGEGYVIGVVLKALNTSPSFRAAVRG